MSMSSESRHAPIKSVLYVTSRFPALSATFIANEMDALSQRGVDVHVGTVWSATGTHTGHDVELPFLDKVQSTRLTAPKTWIRVFRGLVQRPAVFLTVVRLIPGHLKSPWLLAKLIASAPKGIALGHWVSEQDIDWIHAHFLTSPTTVAMLASEVSGVPFSATAHAFDITSQHPRRVNGSIVQKIQAMNLVVTISDFNRRDIHRRWPQLVDEPIEVIYNGIDTERFTPSASHTPLARRPTQLLSISNLNAKKGFDWLIRSMGVLRDRGSDAQLRIFGDGPDRAILQTLIQELELTESVTLGGPVSQAQVQALCQEADIYILASVPLDSDDADGLPTVLIESLACALPTISTHVTGIPEIIIDGTTGLCVPPRDPEAMADAIQRLIDDPMAAQAMANAGRELVLAQFDKHRSAKSLIDVWSNAITLAQH